MAKKLIKGRHKSAIKAHRKTEKATIKNSSHSDEIKKIFRKIKKAVEKKDTSEANKLLKEYYSKIDKAVKIKIVHSNNAARKKAHASRLIAGITKAGNKNP